MWVRIVVPNRAAEAMMPVSAYSLLQVKKELAYNFKRMVVQRDNLITNNSGSILNPNNQFPRSKQLPMTKLILISNFRF